MAPEIDLSNQRPADYVFDKVVETAKGDLAETDAQKTGKSEKSADKTEAAAV